MRHLVVADLAHSIRIWGGSLVLLAVTQVCILWAVGLVAVGAANLITVVRTSGVEALLPSSSGDMPADVHHLLPAAMLTVASMSCIVTTVVASLTIRNVVNAIVFQRRRVIALWQLAGMTEAQLLRILRGQVAILAAVALLVSLAVAVSTVDIVGGFLRGTGLLVPPFTTDGIHTGYAVGAVLALLICVGAVNGVSRELRTIDPLEALRSEGVRELPMTRRRWIASGIWGGLSIILLISALTSRTLESATGAALLAGTLGVVVLNTAGPVLAIHLVSFWTRAVPEHLSASWFLARMTLLAATSRTVSTVASIATAVFLFTTFSTTITSGDGNPGGGGSDDPSGFILLVGLPLAISVTGSVVLVFIAGQQREREIHLAELAGATPSQQRRQALFEAVIVVVTGAAAGLWLSFLSTLVMQPATVAERGSSDLAVAWLPFLGVTTVLLALNVTATVVPTMIAHASRDRVALTA